MKKSYRVGIAAGLIPALFKIILFLTGYTEPFSGSYTNLAELVVVIIAVPLAVYIERRENDLLPFNTALKTGIATATFTAVIMGLFTYVYLRFINTSIQDNALEEAIKYAREQKLNAEETKKTVYGAVQFFSPSVQATTALFWMMVTGGIASILSAVVLRKE